MSKKKLKFFFIVLLILILSLYAKLILATFYPSLPKKGEAAKFYSNQCRDDLNFLFLHAIKKASRSIHLVMFGLTDKSILQALKKTSASKSIYYDKRASDISPIDESFHPLKLSGLIHQKILVIDKNLVFIGSANMTKTSLLMHNNFVLGFYSPKIAKFLMEKTPFGTGEIKATVSRQRIALFLLPSEKALASIKRTIRSSKHKIKVAMFTLTNMELIEELIRAKQRNVEVLVVIDYNSAIGTSREAIEKLKKEKIKVMVSQGIQLLHHKYLYVDEKTLISGSANWTKAAFTKNKDIVLILHNLTKPQKKFIEKLQRIIEKEALEL